MQYPELGDRGGSGVLYAVSCKAWWGRTAVISMRVQDSPLQGSVVKMPIVPHGPINIKMYISSPTYSILFGFHRVLKYICRDHVYSRMTDACPYFLKSFFLLQLPISSLNVLKAINLYILIIVQPCTWMAPSRVGKFHTLPNSFSSGHVYQS